MERHPFDPDEYGDCRTCPLPKGSRFHLTTSDPEPTQAPPTLTAVASLGVVQGPTQERTSQTAALAAWPRAGSARARVLEAITRAGDRGVTDDELLDRLDGMSPNTLRPRRGELVTAGWVRAATREDGRPLTRASGHGNPATVWVLTDAARAQRVA